MWRAALAEGMAQHFAMNARHNQGTDNYYKDVFVQCVNLWKTSGKIKELVTDRRLGGLAAALAGVNGIRLYRDHALVKAPWAGSALAKGPQTLCRLGRIQRTGMWTTRWIPSIRGGR